MRNRQIRQPQQARQARRLGHARQRGFMLLDIVLACAMLAIIFSFMAGGAHLLGKGQKTMDSRRAATRLAESVMTSLQAGQAQSLSQDVKVIALENVVDPAAAADAAGSRLVWCQVLAKVNAIEVSLIGQVPEKALAKQAKLNAIEEVTP